MRVVNSKAKEYAGTMEKGSFIKIQHIRDGENTQHIHELIYKKDF